MAQFPPAVPYGVTAQSLGVFADGNDHSAALAAGISALPAGSSIYFSAGTYVLNHFTISNSVRLFGDRKSATILSQGDASQTNFITLAANNVVFERMTIQATGTTTNGVYIPTGTTDITFNQAKVTGASLNGVNAFSTSRLKVFLSEFSGSANTQFLYTLETGQTCSDLIFESSFFDGSGVTSPYVSLFILGQGGTCLLTNVQITNNVFKTKTMPTTETDCLVVDTQGANANTFDRVVISGNLMVTTNAATTSACYGLELTGALNAVVTGNVFEYCGPSITTEVHPTSLMYPSNVIIANNLITPNTVQGGITGIYAYSGTAVSIIGNVITAANSYGIYVGANSTIVKGNSVVGTGNVGIRVSGSNAVVEGNIIYGAGYGISLQGTVSNIQIRNNYLNGGNYGIWQSGTLSSVHISGNTFNGMTHNYNTGLLTTAGVIVTDDNAGTNTLQNVPAILGTYTVATLPAASAALTGAAAVVTDAIAPVWGTTLTGGGTVVCHAICQGIGGWLAA